MLHIATGLLLIVCIAGCSTLQDELREFREEYRRRSHRHAEIGLHDVRNLAPTVSEQTDIVVPSANGEPDAVDEVSFEEAAI